MICANCGKAIPENAKFCNYCGAKVPQETEKTCPVCGWKGGADSLYCAECGTLLSAARPAPQAAASKADKRAIPVKRTDPTSTFVSAPDAARTVPNVAASKPTQATGRILKESSLFSMYDGEPTVGIAQATGNLRVYEDRVEFEKKLGNSLKNMFGLLGMAASTGEAKKDPLVTLRYSDVQNVRTGKYGGVYNTLVLEMRNGSKTSFVPAMPGSALPGELVDMIRRYLA